MAYGEVPAPGAPPVSTVLAVDIGGSALKACLFDLDGEELATASVPLSFAEDASGRSEQDPQLWWDAFRQAFEVLAGQSPARAATVAAVAACGMTRTQVLLDADHKVLRPAIGFRDARAAAVAAEAAARHASLGGSFNAFHPAARLLWLRQTEPETFAATRLVLEPKDYLNLRLTGQAMSDPISQHWLGQLETAAALGIDRNLLPRWGRPFARVGTVVPDLPGALGGLAGAPVFCGSNDTWAAVAGLGALAAGHAYCISGSSEVFGVLVDGAAAAEGLITIPWDDLWHIGGPGQNGANTLDWLIDLLDPREAPRSERLEALAAGPTSAQPLVFHPFLHGERVPFWDADLRAAFLGLGAAHGPADLVRAVMEGVAFLNRTVLERAERAAGQAVVEIRIAGGGGRSRTWNQIRADILQRPVLAAPRADMGLTGCLAVARVGLGRDVDMAAAGAALARGFTRFTPDRNRRARADALYAVFQDSHAAIASTSHRLAEIGRRELLGRGQV
jgi:xylulokinase